MEQLEKDILIKCREGDKEAFRQVVRQYQRMVFSLALKMLCDEEEAKDTVQDTFIRVWQNIGEYDTAKSFVTWIYTIATRLCLDRIKAQKHTKTWTRSPDLPPTTTVKSTWKTANGLPSSGCWHRGSATNRKPCLRYVSWKVSTPTKCSASPASTPHKSRATSMLPVRQYANN